MVDILHPPVIDLFGILNIYIYSKSFCHKKARKIDIKINDCRIFIIFDCLWI